MSFLLQFGHEEKKIKTQQNLNNKLLFYDRKNKLYTYPFAKRTGGLCIIPNPSPPCLPSPSPSPSPKGGQGAGSITPKEKGKVKISLFVFDKEKKAGFHPLFFLASQPVFQPRLASLPSLTPSGLAKQKGDKELKVEKHGLCITPKTRRNNLPPLASYPLFASLTPRPLLCNRRKPLWGRGRGKEGKGREGKGR